MLAGFLAVQSILLGFTFNVMFFLAGNKPTREVRATSIEGRLRADRLRILYRELFFNVSYFNFVAICSISVAVLLLLPSPAIPAFALQWAPVVDYVEWLGSSPLPPLMQAALKCFAMFTFYALVIEVIFSISRVIGRTSFYFEKKMGETPAVEPGES
jgi:sterol desaturase/sphingolipid hydroxylase (fatty acid hydroxylase superfamily)